MFRRNNQYNINNNINTYNNNIKNSINNNINNSNNFLENISDMNMNNNNYNNDYRDLVNLNSSNDDNDIYYDNNQKSNNSNYIKYNNPPNTNNSINDKMDDIQFNLKGEEYNHFKMPSFINNDQNICYSLQIDKDIPTNISEFGKFLVIHIEQEENYKTIFLRELNEMKNNIKKIFDRAKITDHCLTDYMLDIWDRIEVSYNTRYQIMKNMSKLDAENLYIFLDKETEYLTNYFQITENIFKQIKERENIKMKLQMKTNRGEIILPSDNEKLESVSEKLDEDIKMLKNKYEDIDIIWKGIYYEWFMNYEKWFYEMEAQNEES